ncbi:hypothetical protein Tco_1308008 [Tanacetum coccineum]
MAMIAMIREVAEGQSTLLWFEKMKSVFHISNCTVACQIKFATCTLLGSALTWWNSHVKTFGNDAAYVMTWKTLKKMMTGSYTQHFQELALMYGRMFPEESDEKIRTFAERQVENKRKLDDNSRNNHTQQQPHKRRNIVRILQKSQENGQTGQTRTREWKECTRAGTLNLTVHCCGLEFRVLNGYDQKSFDEERGLN